MATTSKRRCTRFESTGCITAVRHGQRADHADHNWHETAERPHDPPLTEFGKEQAAATGAALHVERVDAVYSSPFTRCMETAAAIAKEHGLQIRVEPGIGEMLADSKEHGWGFEEEPYTDKEFGAKRLAKRFNVDARYMPIYKTAADAGTGDRISFPESWSQATARYQHTLCEVQRTEPFAVLVTHGAGVKSIAESVLSEDDVDDCNYCCITQLHQAGGGRWRCMQRGTAHHGLVTAAADQLVLH